MNNIVLEKINFENGSAGGTPLNKTNLNNMQQNTEDAINTLKTSVENELNPILVNATDLQKNVNENTADLLATKQFIENSMKTMEKEGTSIHVSDSADYPCQLKIEGKSEQVQTQTSPSPDYPSEIENVSGDLEVKAIAKNLFNINDENIEKVNCSEVLIEGNSITIKSTAAATLSRATFPVKYPTNKPISISFEATFLEGFDLANDTMVYFRKSNNNLGGISLIKDENKHIYKTTINSIAEKDYRLWLYVKSSSIEGAVKVKFENIQIEVGETATEFEEYKEQSVTFPLAEGQKLMKDGYLASDGIHNKRIQVVLTGNEEFLAHSLYDTANYNCYRYVLPKAYKKATNQYTLVNALCSHLGIKDWISFYRQKKDEEGFTFTIDNNNTLYIKIDKTIAPTLNDLKSYLSAQNTAGTPVIVEYEMQEEETTPYTEEQQTAKKQIDALKTYRTVTNISNNQDTNIVLTYKKDIQAQFAEWDAKMELQLQQIQALILESGV